MLTRARWTTQRSLLLGAVAGLAALASLPAAAEQVAVSGADVTAAQTESERRQAELKEHLEALNEQLKQRLDESLKQQPAASMKLALAEISGRG